MAVPTITSVSPATGTSAGLDLVRVAGTNFAVDANGQPMIAVLFGGREAELIAVVNDGGASFADVRTPAQALANGVASLVLDVVVVNLDDEGDPVAGEEATAEDAFTVSRLDLATASPLNRLVHRLCSLLSEQLSALAGREIHVDYDDEPGDAVRVVVPAQLPSVTLSGPRISFSGLYTSHKPRAVTVPGGAADERVVLAPSEAFDLEFTLMVVTDNRNVALDLLTAVQAWRARNRWVRMTDAPSSATELHWPVDFGEYRTSARGPDNLRASSVLLTVRGFELDEGLPLDRSRLITDSAVSVDRVEG